MEGATFSTVGIKSSSFVQQFEGNGYKEYLRCRSLISGFFFFFGKKQLKYKEYELITEEVGVAL